MGLSEVNNFASGQRRSTDVGANGLERFAVVHEESGTVDNRTALFPTHRFHWALVEVSRKPARRDSETQFKIGGYLICLREQVQTPLSIVLMPNFGILFISRLANFIRVIVRLMRFRTEVFVEHGFYFSIRHFRVSIPARLRGGSKIRLKD